MERKKKRCSARYRANSWKTWGADKEGKASPEYQCQAA